MELPASEIEFWRAYYNIYPFPQEREDARTALLAKTITNMSGRMIMEMFLTEITDFLPDYLDERNLANKTEKQQIEAEKAFAAEALAKGLAVMEEKR